MGSFWLNLLFVNILGCILSRIFTKLDMMGHHESVIIAYEWGHGLVITAVFSNVSHSRLQFKSDPYQTWHDDLLRVSDDAYCWIFRSGDHDRFGPLVSTQTRAVWGGTTPRRRFAWNTHFSMVSSLTSWLVDYG